MHRQTESDSLAPGHWAENAPLNGLWVRLCMRIMLPTGRRLQCFFTGGGGSASERQSAQVSLCDVLFSPRKKRAVACFGFSSTATLGCVVL